MADIRQLKSTSSKQEEIAFLEKIVKLAGEGTYLSDLFTKELVADLKRRITDDWSCDIYAEYLTEQKNHTKTAEDLVNYKRDQTTFVKDIALLKQKLAAAEANSEHLTEECAHLQTSVNSRSEDAEKLYQELQSITANCHQLVIDKNTLVDAIREVIFDGDHADHEREMLKMILTGGEAGTR